jgi:hypothetical protein
MRSSLPEGEGSVPQSTSIDTKVFPIPSSNCSSLAASVVIASFDREMLDEEKGE